jgi:hypothetical protein
MYTKETRDERPESAAMSTVYQTFAPPVMAKILATFAQL